ncbi:MAG TPA: hypothetical protein VHZ51_16150 [Ktedonobacteraceae bacterium]|nr:hypothetical protein [Ktedonobacteraceae bacterium]
MSEPVYPVARYLADEASDYEADLREGHSARHYLAQHLEYDEQHLSH